MVGRTVVLCAERLLTPYPEHITSPCPTHQATLGAPLSYAPLRTWDVAWLRLGCSGFPPGIPLPKRYIGVSTTSPFVQTDRVTIKSERQRCRSRIPTPDGRHDMTAKRTTAKRAATGTAVPADSAPATGTDSAPATVPSSTADSAPATGTADVPATGTADSAPDDAKQGPKQDPYAIPATSDGVATALVDMYRGGDAKLKAGIRKRVAERKDDAIRLVMAGKLSAEQGMAQAGFWQRTLDALASAPAKRATDGVDPLAVVANAVATLRLAADLLASGFITPDGLDMPAGAITAEWHNGVLLSTSLPAGIPDAPKAERIARAKQTRADQRDLTAWITRAFDGMDIGKQLTVAQIITRGIPSDGSDDGYRPGNGAVTSRLIGGEQGCTVPGVSHAYIGTDRKHGGERTA